MIKRRLLLFLGKYDLRQECWYIVNEQHGKEYADKFVKAYDRINNGESIGNLRVTMAFLDSVEQVKNVCDELCWKNILKRLFKKKDNKNDN